MVTTTKDTGVRKEGATARLVHRYDSSRLPEFPPTHKVGPWRSATASAWLWRLSPSASRRRAAALSSALSSAVDGHHRAATRLPAMLIGRVIDSAGVGSPAPRSRCSNRTGARDHRRQRRVPHRRSSAGHGRVQRAPHRVRGGELHRRAKPGKTHRAKFTLTATAQALPTVAVVGYGDEDALARSVRTRESSTVARHVHHARGHREAAARERASTSFGRPGRACRCRVAAAWQPRDDESRRRRAAVLADDVRAQHAVQRHDRRLHRRRHRGARGLRRHLGDSAGARQERARASAA